MKPGQSRALNLEDAESVHQILAQGKNLPGSPAWSYKSVEDSLRYYSGIGIEDDRGIAAFILFRDLPGSREILHLSSADRVRRQGWMEKLLGELIQGQSIDSELWLEVHEANEAARKLYLKMGFSEVGRRPRYYADGGTAVLYNHR